MDTLKRIALDRTHGLIDDREARRRQSRLAPVTEHRDPNPFDGDGGWDEGDPDDFASAVIAMQFTGELTEGQVLGFFDMLAAVESEVSGTHAIGVRNPIEERTDTMTRDTLVNIALDWADGRIGDEEARDRADRLPKLEYHRDDDPYTGDGGWYEGDPDNRLSAVQALAVTGELTAGQVHNFETMMYRD